MMSYDLLQALKKIPKSFFSVSDIRKFYSGTKGSLSVLLARLNKRGLFQKIMRGYYAFDANLVDFEEFACTVKRPSYISLEYALYHHGFIDQIPETVTLITAGKSHTMECAGKILEYSHISRPLFFGYEIVNNALIATKEKALLDELYLILLKKRSFTIDPMWFKKINKPLFMKYIKVYPDFVKKYCRSIVA